MWFADIWHCVIFYITAGRLYFYAVVVKILCFSMFFSVLSMCYLLVSFLILTGGINFTCSAFKLPILPPETRAINDEQ